MPLAGITIEADLVMEAAPGSAMISVRDQGPGVPDYALERVFEPFFSLPRPDGSPKSTGLGLGFVQEVAASTAGAQTLAGPALIFPYTIEWTEVVLEDVAGAPAGTSRVRREYPRRTEGRWVILPSVAEWDSQAATDYKRRGLFKALVYDLATTVTGRFEVPAAPTLPGVREGARVTWGTAFVSLLISDTRGLSSAPRLTLDGQDLDFRNGSGLGAMSNGIRAEFAGITPGSARALPFTLTFSVRGTESLSFIPLVETTRVALASAWPHPSFSGAFLPSARDQRIDADGFRASWERRWRLRRRPPSWRQRPSARRVGMPARSHSGCVVGRPVQCTLRVAGE